jgi:hypothetical protein
MQPQRGPAGFHEPVRAFGDKPDHWPRLAMNGQGAETRRAGHEGQRDLGSNEGLIGAERTGQNAGDLAAEQ